MSGGAERYGPVKARSAAGALAGVSRELAEERAAAMGRAGRRLTDALAALEEEDAASGGAGVGRRALLEDARDALFCFVVQREACGLRDTASIIRELAVPREVWLWMGPRRRAGG